MRVSTCPRTLPVAKTTAKDAPDAESDGPATSDARATSGLTGAVAAVAAVVAEGADVSLGAEPSTQPASAEETRTTTRVQGALFRVLKTRPGPGPWPLHPRQLSCFSRLAASLATEDFGYFWVTVR